LHCSFLSLSRCKRGTCGQHSEANKVRQWRLRTQNTRDLCGKSRRAKVLTRWRNKTHDAHFRLGSPCDASVGNRLLFRSRRAFDAAVGFCWLGGKDHQWKTLCGSGKATVVSRGHSRQERARSGIAQRFTSPYPGDFPPRVGRKNGPEKSGSLRLFCFSSCFQLDFGMLAVHRNLA
jgi:hypothetical protein